jgi:hypothetical protein
MAFRVAMLCSSERVLTASSGFLLQLLFEPFSETSGSFRTIRRYKPEGCTVHSCHREKLKPNMIYFDPYPLLCFFFLEIIDSCRSRDSDWLRAGRLRGRSSSPGRVKNFLFSMSSRPALGSTQPRIQWVPGVKRSGREAGQSPPASAEVKKSGSIHLLPHTPSWNSA